jgi:CHAT domain-containing protein
LWQGSIDALDRARADLEEALAAGGYEAAVLGDLAAVLYQMALQGGRPDLFVLSYEASARSLEAEPGRPEALFNRALALTRLRLTAPARAAWDAYLEVDPASDWAAEARRWREGLGEVAAPATEVGAELLQVGASGAGRALEDLVHGHRQQAREWAERDLLAAWGTAHLAGDVRRGREHLRLARGVAAVLAQGVGDRMLADGLGAVAGAEPGALDVLAAGHRAHALGYDRLYEDWDLDGAERAFRDAEAAFSAGGSPFVHWASFYRALIAAYRNRYAGSRAMLGRLERAFPPDRYPALAGRVAWIDGLAASKMQDLQASADSYREAVRTFRRLGEEQNLAAAQGLLASAESKLGRHETAWRLTVSALERRPALFSPTRLHAILEDAVINAERQGLLRAALAFADEHIAALDQAAGAQLLHNAHMRRGGLLAALGRREEAREALRRAVALREAVASPEIADRADADRHLEEGKLLAGRAPGQAVRHLSAAIRVYLMAGELQKLPEAYGLRAAAHRRLGDLSRAEADLAERISLLDAARRGLISELDRSLYVRQTASAYDAMIDFQATVRRRPGRALEVAEQGRAALFDEWARQAGAAGGSGGRVAVDLAGGVTLDAVRSRLPPRAAVVAYAVLDDRLLVWVLTRRTFEEVTVEVEAIRLNDRLQALLAALAAGGDGYRAPARQLRRWLIEPVSSHLGGVDRLLLVPDKALTALPFEALVEGFPGRHLLEDFEIATTPSLSLFVRLADRARRPSSEGRVLVVGGDSGPGGVYPALPGARLEAEAVAALYSNAELLRGEGCPVSELLSLLRQATVFHFAGHAVPGDEPPHLPRLVLEDRRGSLCQVDGRQLGPELLERARLVVLSACSTARAEDLPDVVATLARPFLAAGVPAFVGGRWEVEDRATTELFAAFHDSLAEGLDPAASLRRAQMELLGSDDPRLRHPRAWAAFTVTGAPFGLTAVGVPSPARPASAAPLAVRNPPPPSVNSATTGASGPERR